MMVTNCTAERSFSKMKLIKDRLCTTMTQRQLEDRTILKSEFDVLDQIDWTDFISDFANQKTRQCIKTD